MEVISITLVCGCAGPDIALIEVGLPSSTFPFVGNAHVKMEIGQGMGKNYIEKHFPGISLKIIDSVWPTKG